MVLDVVGLVTKLLDAVLNGLAQGLSPQPGQTDCGVLKNGTQYNIQSADGRFAVVDTNKKLAFLQQIPASDASRFIAVEKSCNIFGLCVNGFCMSRCEGCTSDSNDFETVSFHINNSDGGYSQWILTSSTVGGPYVLQVDNKNYLTYKQTASGGQLTLSTELNEGTIFNIILVN